MHLMRAAVHRQVANVMLIVAIWVKVSASTNKLDWNVKSSFNPHMTPELRLKLFINGVSDMDALEGMAERLNFPSNWKTLRTPDAVTPVVTPTPAND